MDNKGLILGVLGLAAGVAITAAACRKRLLSQKTSIPMPLGIGGAYARRLGVAAKCNKICAPCHRPTPDCKNCVYAYEHPNCARIFAAKKLGLLI